MSSIGYLHNGVTNGFRPGALTELFDYQAPEWVKGLRDIPSKRLHLAHLPTPIHKWDLPGVPGNFEVYIKRDDMTGCTLSGNKIRKLEFLLADALQNGCKHVITCGSIQSNHCRATAVACAQLGLKCHIVLRSDAKNVEEIGDRGNLFLDKLSGANMYHVSQTKIPDSRDTTPVMKKIAQDIKARTGEDAYIIPVGGTTKVGLYGYIEGFNELLAQNVTEYFDDIVFGCGSGGTAEGLGVGNYLSKAGLKIHGVAVSDEGTYFHGEANKLLPEIGIGGVSAESLFDIVDGPVGLGYGISTRKELDFVADVASKTGIFLDGTYSGKAAKGLVDELQNNPERFKGNRILFIHTGGVFGMYDGRLDGSVLDKPSKDVRRVMWEDLEPELDRRLDNDVQLNDVPHSHR